MGHFGQHDTVAASQGLHEIISFLLSGVHVQISDYFFPEVIFSRGFKNTASV
jgi:hypothetical protein